MVHIGDIRSADDGTNCTLGEYIAVAQTLLQSHAPVFIVVAGMYANGIPLRKSRRGNFDHLVRRSCTVLLHNFLDNEWNNCPNIDEAYQNWLIAFDRFDELWNHDLPVIRNEKRKEIFSFVSKRSLFIGLNMVGGRVHDEAKWSERLDDQFKWIKLFNTGDCGRWQQGGGFNSDVWSCPSQDGCVC